MARKARGRPPTAERTPDESRAALLDAAASVFAAKGYRSATVDEVVAASGLSKGTFYWHFPSKADLFLALLDERVDAPVRALVEAAGAAPTDTSMAETVGAGLAELFVAERDLVLLLHEYWAAAARDDALGVLYRQRQEALRSTLAAALAIRHERTGIPMTMEAAALAEAFLALANGLSLAALVDPDAVDSGLFGEIASLVYDGMVFRSSARG